MTRRARPSSLLAVIAALFLAACGGSVAPSPAGTGSVAPSAPGTGSPGPANASPLVVGPVELVVPAVASSGDLRGALGTLETADRSRVRAQAGLEKRVGAGWGALVKATDAALDAGIRSLAPDFGVEPPVASGDGRLASIGRPPSVVESRLSASAAAVALIMGSLVAGQALGSGGTHESSSTRTESTTEGDEVATVTARLRGTIVSTGSRVVADFTFDLSGEVVNRVTGAVGRMHGTATAHVEIDGCPDVNGSSKGKLILSSSEEVSGGTGASAGWSRDLSGDFDISVDDNASTSGIVNNVAATETVTAGPDADDVEPHELGLRAHWEVAVAPGFSGLTPNDSVTDGEVTHETDATQADFTSLMRSAAYGVTAAAVLLGQEAERFWRGGKCVELIVDPAGGDVDPDSVTDVVAKVKHRFEGNELDKPVEATLLGVAAIDPAGEKQPAPATVKFTAGADEGDIGEIAFKTVSKRGIAEKSVKFTVRRAAWDVTFSGTDTETFAIVKNTFQARISALRITAAEQVLSGTGKLRLNGTVTSGSCRGPLDVTASSRVTGTLVGSGPQAKLHITITSTSPAGAVVHMRCQPAGGADIGGDGHAERFGEALMEFDLPAAGGRLTVTKTASIGGIMQVTVKGTFTVTLARP